MVPLPLFKFATLFVKHISKYGANWIKAQAHDHPKFRATAANYGQTMHQLNMRMQVTLLRDVAAEKRAKEKAAAPTAKTEEQARTDAAKEEKRARDSDKEKDKAYSSSTSIWRRKFRSLPEAKAVDLFADVIGDTFILLVAAGLIMYEFVRSKGKPDTTADKLSALDERLKELSVREKQIEDKEKIQLERVQSIEEAIQELKAARDAKPKTIMQLLTAA